MDISLNKEREKNMNIITYLQNNQFIALLVALPIAILANILAGSILANFKGTFDWKVFFIGILKMISLYAIFGAMIFVSMIVVISEIDIPTVARAIMYVVTVSYVWQVFDKVKKIMNFDAAKQIVDNLKEGQE